MRSILHGTWLIESEDRQGGLFFVWAERVAQETTAGEQHSRIWRHPYAATTIEIADVLREYVPEVDWHAADRLTRVVYLPSRQRAPVTPGWLAPEQVSDDGEELHLRPWRVEGLGIPASAVLDLLVALPMADRRIRARHRLGEDLRYWGLAAKLALELLARQRFLPAIRGSDGHLLGTWAPVLHAAQDEERFTALAKGMPTACRAVVHERDASDGLRAHRASGVLQSFLDHLVDVTVRNWAAGANDDGHRTSRLATMAARRDVSKAWWRALSTRDPEIEIASSKRQDLERFYQAWQSWTYRAKPQTGETFRICFRLEPPVFDDEQGEIISRHWTLRYFLQALDDRSLLVPAAEVWRERGDVLSYLNRRFNNPQKKLLEGLGAAAELCPAIQRSLKQECPESTRLTDQEAFRFLREVARLLEGAGFGVMVPPWWNSPDTRLRVSVKLKASPDRSRSGILGMDSLVEYDWELALGDEILTQAEFERLAALKTPLVQVRGRWVLLQPDQIESAVAFWEKHRDQGHMPLHEALNLALGAEDELGGLPISDIELGEGLSGMLDALTQQEELEILDPPQGLEGTLRPYQVEGYSWLAFLRRWGFGACLADDMGLGKTIQAIALVLYDQETDEDAGPSLVICPTSLVGNWRREVARFAPSLNVVVHHGSDRAEGEAFVEQSQRNDLVISTYGLVRRDIEDLTKVRWSNIILDEAQNVKNPMTQQARAVRRLQGVNRVALTGTPIENRLSELWSIMGFLNPGYLGRRSEFRRTFALPIERYQDQEAMDRLRNLVRPFILRRLKTDPRVIQDLPEKFEHKIYCNLTREQATLYEAVVRDAMGAIDETNGNGQGMRRRGMVLAMLTRLKQVCNHPALYLGDGSRIEARSGKLNRLVEMLEEILEMGERALIFTQFAQMGFLLQEHLQQVFGGRVFFLHGGTPQKKRDQLLDRFQSNPSAPAIFVLSLKAGGTGLNLMRANHVFHYDRWWNPAVENQATDRAYRIGQERDVQVHKFICLGTLEEHIDALIESKKELAESVIGEGSSWLTELSTDELRDIIALRDEAIETD